MESPVRKDADFSRPPAYAKARVTHDLLQVSGRAGLGRSAQLLLQHLLAIAWPHDDGWTCDAANETLANRLSMNEGHVRRLLIQVNERLDDVVRRTPGTVRREASTYVIDVRALSERASAPCTERAGAPRTERASAQVRPMSERAGAPLYSNSEFSSSSSRGTAAAAEVQALGQQEEGDRVRWLTRRPEWLPESKPWLEPPAALQLVRLAPWATDSDVLPLLKEVRASRLTLDKPAGLFISLWRRMAAAKREVPPCRA